MEAFNPTPLRPDTPAMPSTNQVQIGEYGTTGHPGLTARQHAAIALRVPDSGCDWLDEMITASLRDEFAAKVVQGVLASGRAPLNQPAANFAEGAYARADALLAEREAK